MKERARYWAHRILAPLVLFEWGSILAYFYASHRIVAFLHPNFRPLVLVTGLLLLGTALCIFCSGDGSDTDCGYDCEGDGCGIGRRRLSMGGSLAFAVLLAPIALAARIAPDGYGVVLMRNRGLGEPSRGQVETRVEVARRSANTPEPLADSRPPLPVQVGDLLLAAEKPASMQKLEGRLVELDGRVFVSGANEFELVRMLILCCAADAQPLAIRVQTDKPLDFPAMSWAKVVGKVRFVARGDTYRPVVQAGLITPIAQPADPNVYYGGSRVVMPRHLTSKPFKIPLPPR